MKILHVISSIDPRNGGPIEGVRNQVQYLISQGHMVEVVSLDSPESEYLASFPFIVHPVGPARGKYAFCNKLIPWLKKNGRDYDVVIVNGIWQFHSFATWRALRNSGVPYYVYTHGMLDPWFKKAYPLKHLKKWLYWPWADYRVLRDAKSVIFTCEEERILARKSFWLYKANEAVTSYGAAQPPAYSPKILSCFNQLFPKLAGQRFFLFLSRIHEKKGCDLLIKAFAKIADQAPELQLAIAGPDQVGLKAELQTLAASLGIENRIHWLGMLSGDAKWGAFHASEVFVLPSHQENFGIVVAEALACRKPVLISNKINIWREIEADNAGIVANDDLIGTELLLTNWLAMSNEEQRTMSENAIQSFNSRFTVDAMANSLLKIIS